MTLESLPNPARADKADSSALCTNCGLCCMGALHDRAILEPGEVELAHSLGMNVTEGNPPSFSLGCSLLEGTRCSVYDRRPTPCQFYRCQLLRHLEAGEVSFEEASAKTRVARGLLDKVNATRPPEISLASLRAQARSLGEPRLDESPPNKDEMILKLHFTALAHYLDKYFMNHNDRQHFKTSVVGDAEPVKGKS